MKYHVKIKGLCPILQHRFSEDALTKQTKVRGDKKLDNDQRKLQAEQYLYLNKKEEVCQPSSHIEGAMQKAASQFRLSGAGKKTYKELVKGGVFVFPELIPHDNQKWEVDSRSVVNPSTRGRAMCYRPRIDDWTLGFDLEVNDDRADEDAIKQILEHAGLYVGIGAYRPRFGRFEVMEFARA